MSLSSSNTISNTRDLDWSDLDNGFWAGDDVPAPEGTIRAMEMATFLVTTMAVLLVTDL